MAFDDFSLYPQTPFFASSGSGALSFFGAYPYVVYPVRSCQPTIFGSY